MAESAKSDSTAEGAGGPLTHAPLLRTENLTKHFHIGGFRGGHLLHAVDAVNISIEEGEIVGLVGESGSGKSTIARLLAMVYKPTEGRIEFRGKPLDELRSRKQVLAYRAQVPMVFQDPYSSLNPAHRVDNAIMRGLKLHRPELGHAARQAEAERVLDAVGLSPPKLFLKKYPHEMSGGQRQRIGFAQALSYRPKLILADEPVSMLDVSIRVGVLNLMAKLREEEGVSFLYITHDVASARYVADRILVMYGGHVVENGPTDDVLHRPLHPYTELLLSAAPDPRMAVTVSASDIGEPPHVVDPGEGCRFRWRCPYAADICEQATPLLRTISPGRSAACHLATAELGLPTKKTRVPTALVSADPPATVFGVRPES
ncbi:MAG: ABC transporter ATP-binding protein [Acidimicrobiales bacterium]